jgi:purine nucleosidase
MKKPEPILLDTDIGTDVDDALALVFLAVSPQVQLKSVTTVGAKPELRSLIARRLLSLFNAPHVPVAAGLARPLPSKRFQQLFPEGLWLGHEGKGLLSKQEIETALKADSLAAIEQIISTLSASKESVTVITIGPVSNFGAALQKDPSIAKKIKRFVVMGGSVLKTPRIGKYEMSPMMEFNLNADREAASILFSSGVPITLIPIEVTAQTYLTRKDVHELAAGDPKTKLLATLIEIWTPVFHRLYANLNTPEANYGEMVCHLHDVVAALGVTDPELINFKDVAIAPKETNGIFWTGAMLDGPIRVKVAEHANNEEVSRLLLQRLIRSKNTEKALL